jgi:thiosulfate/3-mercaptopyruvate sulfurtransferase
VTACSNLLVDVETLAAELASGHPPVLLDVRWNLLGPPGRSAYEDGHLPGAVFADLDADLSGRRGAGGRHPLPKAADFQAAMRRLGVSTDRNVVVYDAGNSVPASRAWWDLRYFGHEAVRVLDGGYTAWVAANLPVSKEIPVIAPGDFVARPGQLPTLSASDAARVARDGVLLDVRAAERFRGDVEPVDPVGGRVPGAVNLPTDGNLGPDGRFLDAETLRQRFESVAAQGELGAYCGSGVNAAHTVLAMTLAGLATPALYVGSWSNWITDPERPIATGP